MATMIPIRGTLTPSVEGHDETTPTTPFSRAVTDRSPRDGRAPRSTIGTKTAGQRWTPERVTLLAS